MHNESTILPIKLPVELCRLAVWQRSKVNKYQTNSFIKAVGTWIVLKHLSTPSLLQNWNGQKDQLLICCKVVESTFRLHLKMLATMKLLTFDRHNIRLCSWDELGKALDIDIEKKQTIHYDISDKKTVAQWIIATEINDNQERQAYKIISKLNKNPELKTILIHAMIAAGADKALINQPSYLLNWLRVLYMADFCRVSDIHKLIIELRPDTNRGVRGISHAWSKGNGSEDENRKEVARNVHRVVYWKKVLKRCGIIDVAKLQIESTTRTRNEHCRVLWLPSCKNSPRKDSKQTLLCLCDQITVLMPWLLESDQKKLAA